MDQVVAFEFVEDFDFVRLEKCATYERIYDRVFVCRRGDFYCRWKLCVTPKDKQREKETFGLSLHSVDPPGVLSVHFTLFAGNKEICKSMCNRKFAPKSKYTGWCIANFLPTVTSLTEHGLVVDGVVKLGVKILLKASDFDPFKWLPAPSLTPDTSRLARQLFANLGTDNHRTTDFILIVGEGDARKELHVSQLAFRAVPFFDRMFADDSSKENQEGVLHLPTHTADAVIEALRFVYLNEVGVDLTQFLPSLLILASEWELKPLVTAIERAMIVKLQTDRTNTDLAADYLDLATKYSQDVVSCVATCILMDNWTEFVVSPKGKGINEVLKDKVSLVMAAAAVYKGVYTGMDPDWLKPLPLPSLISNGALGKYYAANLGTDNHLGTDFTIVVGEGEATVELHVSRLALTVVPFFGRMFGNGVWTENKEGVLRLPTHTVDAVIEALKFVYQNEVGVNLTRFLPSLLSLASEWELDDLMVAIERDMVKKLMDDRFGYDHETAAEYFELAEKYNRKVVSGLAIRKVIEAWPKLIESQKGKDMDEKLKNKATCVMAAIASGAPIDDGE